MINVYVDAYSKKSGDAVYGVFPFTTIPCTGDIVFLNPNEENEVRLEVVSVTHFAGAGGDGASPPSYVHINGEVIE